MKSGRFFGGLALFEGQYFASDFKILPTDALQNWDHVNAQKGYQGFQENPLMYGTTAYYA